MTRREKLLQALGLFAGALLAGVLARYGVEIPPPVVPPPVGTIPPTTPPIGPTPDAKPDTPKALAKIQFGNAGCTATVIGPRRDDGRYWVLTASHCVERIGQHGTMRLLDGRTTGLTVMAFDRKADCCWCVTESNSEIYPFAFLAETAPAVGSRIWHAGYGVDRPGNREDGVVEAPPDANGQVRFRLNVSSGDSGGGICTNEAGEVVSCVCCTTSRGSAGSVWGAGPDAIRRARPTAMVMDDWRPIEVPIRMPPVP